TAKEEGATMDTGYKIFSALLGIVMIIGGIYCLMMPEMPFLKEKLNTRTTSGPLPSYLEKVAGPSSGLALYMSFSVNFYMSGTSRKRLVEVL
ncbi:MAG: hypothetical protein ACFNLS_04620, partial [Lancefieldella sp.]